ncbi:MAG: hypothetical protein ACOC57_06070 [Acidobacteriota bacterium]
MKKFFQIQSLSEEEQESIIGELEDRIQRKKELGLYSDKEIKEIENMKLRPLPDIQDVQSVYENFLFQKNR